ncbi:MAG TPA: hypothetical protein VEF76_14985 [Patescibacteria group bacterium]|nr:hypothetical protein [Patescibacteria group bacterium]
MTPGELRSAFAEALDKQREQLQSRGVSSILKDLSETIGFFQEAGIEASIKVMPGGHSNAYDMMYVTSKPSGGNSGTIDAYGYISIGSAQRLFAVASKIGKEDVCRLYVSDFNVTVEGGRNSTDNGGSKTTTVIPGKAYDFKEDAEALKKLQRALVSIAAEYSAVTENDVARVFNRPVAAFTKPAGRLKL